MKHIEISSCCLVLPIAACGAVDDGFLTDGGADQAEFQRDGAAGDLEPVDQGRADTAPATLDAGTQDARSPDRGDSQDAAPSPACAALRDALAGRMSGNPQPMEWNCTLVVRLEFESKAPLAYQTLCGDWDLTLDESRARQIAQRDTGYGDGAQALHPAQPNDHYVFYRAPADHGGVGVVSARTGMAVFGGGIGQETAGAISFPLQWREAEELGPGCASELPPTARLAGYDLLAGTRLEPAQIVAELVPALTRSVVLDAVAQLGAVQSVVALLYPRQVGGALAESAEWVLLVNGGGWL